MPVISSQGGTDTTINELPGGRISLRQGTAFMSFSPSESEQLRDFLNKSKGKREMVSQPVRDVPAHPGVYLQDELDARQMPVKVFIRRSGLPEQMVLEILQGDFEITPRAAVAIHETLGKGCPIDGPTGWLYLQNVYDLAQLTAEPVNA